MSKQDEEMQISEHELVVLTRELDDMHHATLPVMRAAIDEWTELHREEASRHHGDEDEATVEAFLVPVETALPVEGSATAQGSNRRRFLIGAGAAVGGIVLAACSSSKSPSASNSTTTTAPSANTTGLPNPYSGDVAVAALAASLENLAVQTYGKGIGGATRQGYGTIPLAVASFAVTAQAQHKDHASAWNSILAGANKPAVSGVDSTYLNGYVLPGLAGAKNFPELAKFALAFESDAAATYLSAIMSMSSPANIAIAASIQPVEMQHAAILNLVIGNYPVPNAFAQTAGTRMPSGDGIVNYTLT